MIDGILKTLLSREATPNSGRLTAEKIRLEANLPGGITFPFQDLLQAWGSLGNQLWCRIQAFPVEGENQRFTSYSAIFTTCEFW